MERVCKVLDVPIRLSSAPGRGAMFWTELPVAAPTSVTTAPVELPMHAMGSLAGCTVLCIDNEPAVLEGMRALLSGWGCEVLLASSAEAAVATVEPHRQTLQVVLADYHLDKGTGVDAIAAVQQAVGRAVPAVIITADHSPEVSRQLRDNGLLVLRKPLKAAALRSVLMRYTISREAAE